MPPFVLLLLYEQRFSICSLDKSEKRKTKARLRENWFEERKKRTLTKLEQMSIKDKCRRRCRRCCCCQIEDKSNVCVWPKRLILLFYLCFCFCSTFSLLFLLFITFCSLCVCVLCQWWQKYNKLMLLSFCLSLSACHFCFRQLFQLLHFCFLLLFCRLFGCWFGADLLLSQLCQFCSMLANKNKKKWTHTKKDEQIKCVAHFFSSQSNEHQASKQKKNKKPPRRKKTQKKKIITILSLFCTTRWLKLHNSKAFWSLIRWPLVSCRLPVTCRCCCLLDPTEQQQSQCSPATDKTLTLCVSAALV